MKQFILKNIVLAVILVLTLIGSIVLMFFCEGKRRAIAESMATIDENAEKVQSINAARKPNSVAESETKIKADTETLDKKNIQIYRHFGKPYRPALLKLLKNIASPAELKTDLPVELIAERSGFTTMSTFNRNFRAYTNESPLKWKKTHLGASDSIAGFQIRARKGWDDDTV